MKLGKGVVRLVVMPDRCVKSGSEGFMREQFIAISHQLRKEAYTGANYIEYQQTACGNIHTEQGSLFAFKCSIQS